MRFIASCAITRWWSWRCSRGMIPGAPEPVRKAPIFVPSAANTVIANHGLAEYVPVWRAMQDFTATRTAETPDEIWLVQHHPVYTQGLNGRDEHLLDPNTGIPLVRTDRGGQIAYHGPGQIVVSLLLDLARLQLGVNELVKTEELAIIDLLHGHGISAWRKAGAPGVYVGGAKIAALGLRVKRGCCYHGAALNVAMDLTPYRAINPCGYPGHAVTQTSSLGMNAGPEMLGRQLAKKILRLIHAAREIPKRWD